MRLLVISDLHTGSKARTKELCPYPDGEHKEDKLVESFIKTTQDYQNKHGKIDFLIIPGDITNNSNLVEYDCSSKFLEKISKAIDIAENHIIFVPGNHDVDWSILNGIPPEEVNFRRPHKYNTLKDSNHVFSRLCGTELIKTPYIKKWEFDHVVYFGFNSSWHDDAKNDKHYGLIQKDQIDILKSELEKTDLNKLKIFVVHHHLHQFDNPHPKWIDISAMQNSQSLINLLSEFSFNFIIHGHRHLPNFLSTTIESFSPINILCAGSYSCEVPPDIAGFVGNLYHIIEIDDYDRCKGRVKSMAYDIREGWIDSKDNHGIEHISPFGNEVKFEDLLRQCSTEINSSSEPVIFYSGLEDKITDLKYLPVLSKKSLFEQIEKECNVKSGNTADDKIFIKK